MIVEIHVRCLNVSPELVRASDIDRRHPAGVALRRSGVGREQRVAHRAQRLAQLRAGLLEEAVIAHQQEGAHPVRRLVSRDADGVLHGPVANIRQRHRIGEYPAPALKLARFSAFKDS